MLNDTDKKIARQYFIEALSFMTIDNPDYYMTMIEQINGDNARDVTPADSVDQVADQIVSDFINACGSELSEYLETLDPDDLGHDLFFTMDGSGEGFHHLREVKISDQCANALTDTAKSIGHISHECGDDGHYYLYYTRYF
jgi:hypothetical protein